MEANGAIDFDPRYRDRDDDRGDFLRTDFNLFIRASRDAFQVDLSRFTGMSASHESAHFICFSNDSASIRVEHTSESGDVRIDFGYPSLGFAKIQWREESKQLTVELDELGLQSLFFYEDGGTVRISNRIEILEIAILKPRLSAKALSFFLVSGFLPTGWNFIEDIQRIDRRSEWSLRDNLKNHQFANWIQYSRGSDPSAVEMVDLLRYALEEIEEEVGPNEIRLSGGADTRIVSALYPKALPAQVVHSPWVPDGKDLDVNLAEAWAREKGHRFEILRVPIEQFHFFAGTSNRPTLSGLAGGEFLGGQFSRVIPADPETWMSRAKQMLTNDMFEELEADPWIRRVLNDEQEWKTECARIFLQSTRSTIYQSLQGSWTTPYALMMRTVSPFTMPLFLKRFLSMSEELLGDYEFYLKVFDAVGPQIQKVPLCSQLTLHRPELRAGPEWGIDPKSIVPRSHAAVSMKDVTDELASICHAKELGLQHEEISALGAHLKTSLAVRSAHAWLKRRYPELVAPAR